MPFRKLGDPLFSRGLTERRTLLKVMVGGEETKSPDQISGLTSWGDADITLYTDAGVTLAVNTDDLVYRIQDLSGNNRHMDQTVLGARGKLKLNVSGGRRGILCDGVDDQYVGVAISNLFTNNALTMFFVAQPTSIAADTGTIYNNDPFWCDAGGFVGLFSKGPAASRFYNFDGSVDETASIAIAINNTYVFACWHSAGTIFAQINNGTIVSTASGNTGGMAGLMDFFKRAAGAAVMGSYYFAHASYNVVLSDADRAAVNNYYRQRFGAA